MPATQNVPVTPGFAKYHKNGKGQWAPCRATERACRYATNEHKLVKVDNAADAIKEQLKQAKANAKTVPAGNLVPPMLKAFASSLSEAWTDETSTNDDWSPERPEAGQCAVTSLIVQDKFGGTLNRATVNGVSHYWNTLPDGTEVDLTRSQFDEPLKIVEPIKRERDYLLGNDATLRRYKQLQKNIEDLTKKKIATHKNATPVAPLASAVSKYNTSLSTKNNYGGYSYAGYKSARGEETPEFYATILKDGVEVGSIKSKGRGGAPLAYWKDAATRKEFDAFVQKDFQKDSKEKGFYLEETFFFDLAEEKELEKELNAALKKGRTPILVEEDFADAQKEGSLGAYGLLDSSLFTGDPKLLDNFNANRPADTKIKLVWSPTGWKEL